MTPSRLTAFSDGVIATYAAACALAFLSGWIADALYVFVAVLWLIPDRRIEPLVGQ